MTRPRPRMCIFRVLMTTHNFKRFKPSKNQKGAWLGIFQTNRQNHKIAISWTPNFDRIIERPSYWKMLEMLQLAYQWPDLNDTGVVVSHQHPCQVSRISLSRETRGFYRATRMHVCTSVCLPICLRHAGVLSKRLYISAKFFHRRVAPPL